MEYDITALGLIDRDGELRKCEYWGHEILAERIIHENGWDDEYEEYKKDYQFQLCHEDFLTHKKGYIAVTASMFGAFRNIYYYMTPTEAQRELIAFYQRERAMIHDYRYMENIND